MNKPLLYLLLLIVIFSSCRKLVQDEFPYREPQPVVNSIFVADSIIKVQVSTSAALGEDPLPVTENAELNLYVNDEWIEELKHDSVGIYISETITRVGARYRCEVQLPNMPMAMGFDSMPMAIPIVAVEHIDEAGKNEEGYSYPAIKFTFKNDPSKQLFFEAAIYIKTSELYRAAEMHTMTDPLIQYEGLPFPLFTNELIEGDEYTMTLNYLTGSHSSNGGSMVTQLYPVFVQLRTISKAYYQYRKQLYLYEQGRYPTYVGGASKVYPLYNNIENGYGIFSAYALSVSDTLKPEDSIPW